jgi:hypothetical protein
MILRRLLKFPENLPEAIAFYMPVGIVATSCSRYRETQRVFSSFSQLSSKVCSYTEMGILSKGCYEDGNLLKDPEVGVGKAKNLD